WYGPHPARGGCRGRQAYLAGLDLQADPLAGHSVPEPRVDPTLAGPQHRDRFGHLGELAVHAAGEHALAPVGRRRPHHGHVRGRQHRPGHGQIPGVGGGVRDDLVAVADQQRPVGFEHRLGAGLVLGGTVERHGHQLGDCSPVGRGALADLVRIVGTGGGAAGADPVGHSGDLAHSQGIPGAQPIGEWISGLGYPRIVVHGQREQFHRGVAPVPPRAATSDTPTPAPDAWGWPADTGLPPARDEAAPVRGSRPSGDRLMEQYRGLIVRRRWRRLRNGAGWTWGGLLFMLFAWGIWAISLRGGDLLTPVIALVLVC